MNFLPICLNIENAGIVVVAGEKAGAEAENAFAVHAQHRRVAHDEHDLMPCL